jgi:hypothetical protein
MSYVRTSRGLGASGFPPGVSIAGSCDPATGAPSGYQTGYYYLETPTGNRCLTDAAISALYPVDPTPQLVPGPGYIPNQSLPAAVNQTPAAKAAAAAILAAGGTLPSFAASPVVCNTPQCQADMEALNSGSQASADTMLGPFDVTQIEAGNFASAETVNGMLVLAACAAGLWLLMRGLH